MRRKLIVSLGTFLCVLVGVSSVAAQSGASIAGVVKDAAGGVLPGVTVEASSPALLEKVRTVVTDGQGQYKIIALWPGVYTVTFTLPGFTTVRREGVELPVNFTATINAELAPAAIEETVTVTGESPVVDVQNTAVRNVINSEVLETVPTALGVTSYASLTVGVMALSNNAATTGAQPQDVGGSSGDVMMHMTYHGDNREDAKIKVDGFETNFRGYNRLFVPDPHSMQEVSLDLGAGAADIQGAGVSLNFVSKSGSNRFRGDVYATRTNENFQNNNINDELISRGLKPESINRFKDNWDFGASVGGPIQRDRLWFLVAYRDWGTATYVAGLFYNKTPEALTYTSDPDKPGINDFDGRNLAVRLRWQPTQRHGFTFSYDGQYRGDRHRDITSQMSPEAAPVFIYSPVTIGVVTWTYPASNRLLFQAGVLGTIQTVDKFRQPEVLDPTIAIREVSTNFTYRSVFGTLGPSTTKMWQPRFSVSYVTGSHNLKVGVEYVYEWYARDQIKPNDMDYTFRNGLPDSLSLYATPIRDTHLTKPDTGVFAQDQWTIKRLTLNLGVRWDYLKRGSPAQTVPASRFRPVALSFDEVDCAPCTSDFQPRLSASYDLFGDGRTALKVNVGRYVRGRALSNLYNPVNDVVSSVTRTWRDTIDRNFSPDCDLSNPLANGECGQISNLRFGLPVTGTQYADDVIHDYRSYSWQYSALVQHELMPRVSASVGYFHNQWYNYTATDNLAVGPADFDPYCITLPLDSRLPGGGGNQLCGFYDVKPELFGRVNNLVVRGEKYGTRTSVYDGIDVTVAGRFPKGAFVGGGLSTGRTATDACFVVDSPEALLFCKVVPPYLTQIKLNGTYSLPYGFDVSGMLQSFPGIPIVASYVATNAQVTPTLGRPLSGGRSSVTLNNIIAPGTMYESRSTQLDLRLAKNFTFGRFRLRANFDVYNTLNGAGILATNTRYGSSWLQPTVVVQGRLFKFSGQLSF